MLYLFWNLNVVNGQAVVVLQISALTEPDHNAIFFNLNPIAVLFHIVAVLLRPVEPSKKLLLSGRGFSGQPFKVTYSVHTAL